VRALIISLACFAALASLGSSARGEEGSCSTLMAALTESNDAWLLKPGAVHEAEILAGEASPALNSARRDLIKQLKSVDGLAEGLVRKLESRGFAGYRRPGEVILALDALIRVRPELFVRGTAGILKHGLPGGREAALLPAIKRQLASRMISGLSVVEAAPAAELSELLARTPWARSYLAQDANAARNLLTAINKISDSPEADLPRRLAGARLLARDWISPRLAFARGKPRSGGLAPTALSHLPEMDWAFAKALSTRLARALQPLDPANARGFDSLNRELSRVPPAASYRENERVRALFREFSVE
jgi:hypothetical protein